MITQMKQVILHGTRVMMKFGMQNFK